MADPIAVGDYPEAGIRVEYFEKPYRQYRLTTRPPCPVELDDEKAVSVTTALGILNKSLDSWVERVTLAGAWTLIGRESYTLPDDREPDTCPWRTRKYVPNFARKCDIPANSCVGGDPALCQFRVDLKNARLDSYAVKHEAADVGTDVHQIWQDWNEQGKIPNAGDYPHNRRPRIRALAKFIMEYKPECLESEKVVGSARHLFAGRLDTVVVLKIPGKGRAMVDLKNSKAIYPDSHFPQLAGYEIARVECGLEPTDSRGILLLKPNGDFELGWSNAEAEDFLAILRAYKSQQKWARR